MSLYPLYIEYEYPRALRPRPRQLLEQNFGLGLTPQDYLAIIAVPQGNQDYYRNWRNLQAAARDVGSSIKEDKDQFQINLDVQHFAPEDISVKIIDGYLVVEAKHEEKQDEHGYISRSFVRRYPLPEGIQEDSVVSRLSSDGVLTISAPIKVQPKAANERVVPIIQTGPVRKQTQDEAIENKEKEAS